MGKKTPVCVIPLGDWHWQVLVMKSCPQKKCSGHICTCECHAWSSSLCAYAFRINESEENNNFKLLSVINIVCKDLGHFVVTMFICFVVWMGNKALHLPPIIASACELGKTRRNSQAS